MNIYGNLVFRILMFVQLFFGPLLQYYEIDI